VFSFVRSFFLLYLLVVVLSCLLQIGLGTGGIPHEEAFDVFSEALDLGYRLFDLAREYGNEHIMREALRSWYQKGI
jgi:diketogulonate reductase-like aldo/keto reductase